jgi:uncharacterized DUF497 family protein
MPPLSWELVGRPDLSFGTAARTKFQPAVHSRTRHQPGVYNANEAILRTTLIAKRGAVRENWRDHGITFDKAVKAFGDPFAIERIDEREAYGEGRRNLLGMCEGILHVSYTERGERIRIISAWRATRHEQDYYYRQNAP